MRLPTPMEKIFSIIFIETNCENQNVRFLKDVYFKGKMAEGDYVVWKRNIGRNLSYLKSKKIIHQICLFSIKVNF